MKTTIPVACMLSLLPTAALANPTTLNTHQLVGTVGIVVTAFFMEIALTAGYLIFLGMAAGPLVAALLFLNLTTYLGVLLPGLGFGVPVVIMEIVVVCLEAVIIKGLACAFFFQGEAFIFLKWRHAFIAAALGNALSYGVGRMLV